MKKTSCLIAGLPSSGKSTYIGALWYNLCNRANEMMMKSSNNLPDDIQHLENLSTHWLKAEKIDRTNSNASDSVLLNMEVKETGKSLSVAVPDFLGETFLGIIDMEDTKKLVEWCNNANTLLYMVNDVSPGRFDDDDEHGQEENGGGNQDIPSLISKNMSEAAKNIMILKFLLARKKFEKVVIALTWWDEVTQDGANPASPDKWLCDNSPAFYNFVNHYCANLKVIGLSAQGCEYKEDNHKGILKKTAEGKRAFVEIDDKIIYDLSLPLYMLMEE